MKISHLAGRLIESVVLVLLFAAPIQAADRPVDTFRPAAQDRFVPVGAKVEVVWNDGEFTEGPTVAADGAILFSDIGDRIMRFDPTSGKTTVFREPSGRSNGLMFDRRGRLVACESAGGGGRRLSITEPNGRVRSLAGAYQGKRFNSPNDLAIDPQGRIYFTDPRYGGDEPREIDFEGVYFIDTDGSLKLATRDLQKPNGILVSLDGKTVYIADNNNTETGNRHLVAFAVQADGTLKHKRVLFNFGADKRGIDGMTLDKQGAIYATAGTGQEAGIYVFSPEGKPLAFVPVPGDPTNCVFGVGKESRRLYITAAGPKPKDGETRRYALYRVGLKPEGAHIFPPDTAK